MTVSTSCVKDILRMSTRIKNQKKSFQLVTERAWLLLYCLADSKKPEVWHSAESHSYQERRNWQRSALPAGGLADDGRHLQVCLAAQTQYKLLQKHQRKLVKKTWPCQICQMGIWSLLSLIASAVSLLLNEMRFLSWLLYQMSIAALP